MKRRTFIQSASIIAALSGTDLVHAKQLSPEKRKTYVLVHGTWHGGWVWQEVAQHLRDAGHIVYCPTLTGCGERKHLASPDVGAETHITDITSLIEYEELNKVILVGHSFSGIIITGVADRVKERIQHIVFFDALVPTTNPMTIAPRTPDGNFSERWLKKRAKFIDGYLMDFWEEYPIDMLVPKSAVKERERLTRLITPHPARAWEDQITLNNGGWENLPRTYIHCVGQTYLKSSENMVGPARKSDWAFIELDIPRNGMMTHAKLIAKIFANMT